RDDRRRKLDRIRHRRGCQHANDAHRADCGKPQVLQLLSHMLPSRKAPYYWPISPTDSVLSVIHDGSPASDIMMIAPTCTRANSIIEYHLEITDRGSIS